MRGRCGRSRDGRALVYGEFHDLLFQKLAESAHQAALTPVVEVIWHRATIDGRPPIYGLRIEQYWVLECVSRSKPSRSGMMGSDTGPASIHDENALSHEKDLDNV